jgi:hypothetical protein
MRHGRTCRPPGHRVCARGRATPDCDQSRRRDRHGDVSGSRLLRIALTVLVPYAVSTFSSVQAARASLDRVEPSLSATLFTQLRQDSERHV